MAAPSLFFGSTTVSSPASVSLSELKALPSLQPASSPSCKPLCVKATKSYVTGDEQKTRRAFFNLAAAALAGSLLAGKANAGLVEDLLAKSAVNKELNDRKRLATSGANTARAYTVTFGTCKFPENFTGCQDLAKIKNVPFLTDDIKLECEGKEKFKCGSNVFWKW